MFFSERKNFIKSFLSKAKLLAAQNSLAFFKAVPTSIPNIPRDFASSPFKGNFGKLKFLKNSILFFASEVSAWLKFCNKFIR